MSRVERPAGRDVDPAIFKAYDVRGIHPDQIDAEVAYRIGRAFARVLGELEGKAADQLRVGLAHDMRLAALRTAYAPEGFNLGVNQGKIAGAGVEHHVHLHVVPRWGADTNFMPVIGDTRVLPQSLDDSYELLSRLFA